MTLTHQMLRTTLGVAAALFVALSLPACDAAPAASGDAAPQATAQDDSIPVTADMLVDGTYDITVDSSSSMFRIVKAELTVQDGSMSCAMTLGGTGYEKLYMGTSEEAEGAADEECAYFVEGDDGAYTYTVPVEALDQDTPCAAFSIRKQRWYDRTLVFESSDLPTSAFQQ